MNQITNVQLKTPYLVFLGDVTEMLYAKTGAGIVQWCPEAVVGQIRLPGCSIDLGVPELSIQNAVLAGARSLIIGVAPMGGGIGANWSKVLNEAAAMGMDIVSGLHTDLAETPGLVETASASGAALINVRRAPPRLPIGTGEKRTGLRLLTVGTDCAVGKKYSALALVKAMREQGMQATFRATGQTGIMIAGSGIPVDSVVSDFICGAAEVISPANHKEHWDVIEGQGSLFNPSYAGVSLGLLHGSQPDALVVCHDATRTQISTCKQYELPSIRECIALNLQCARLTNPKVRCVGICVNTSGLAPHKRTAYLQALTQETGLLCVDPLTDGCASIVDEIQRVWHGQAELA
ncbi:DUF1611 domain-containing protein [Bowmanella denitrificans]|uniref:DUF1611 domain-containing protein n=1 Tax=Bowmanella denitrificans TaxID=366582 RepID=A0ABN0XTF1_9ALTE